MDLAFQEEVSVRNVGPLCVPDSFCPFPPLFVAPLLSTMVWCSCFLSEEEKTAKAIDKEINRLLQEQKKREKRELKLLLLGEYFVPELQAKEGCYASAIGPPALHAKGLVLES